MDWVPFVLEDARAALMQWPQAQDRGMWVAGFYAGASNSIPMGGEPEAFICGFSSGAIARANSESKRASTSEVRSAAAKVRWEREKAKQLEVKGAEYAVVDANACAREDANAMHKTRQDKTRQDRTRTGQESVDTNVSMSAIGGRIDSSAIWSMWKKFNEQGFGVRHLSFTPAMAAAAKARAKECPGVDFMDVVAFGLERMAGNPWFSDKPDAMTLDHFLRPANFQRYTANYTPKEIPA